MKKSQPKFLPISHPLTDLTGSVVNCARPLKIIYEDNHLLAVDKPSGLLTQPSGTQKQNLQSLTKAWIKEKAHKKGNVFLETIHRLDKDVSGIVLFAKTSKALSRLNHAMRQKKFHKTYKAIVEGTPPRQEGHLEHHLIHNHFRGQVVKKSHKNAKLARLHYQVLKTQKGLALLKITLETGRHHQIRAQLAHIGFPILGDRKYGSQKKWQEDSIALHHAQLEFPHPISQKRLVLQAPLPSSWGLVAQFTTESLRSMRGR